MAYQQASIRAPNPGLDCFNLSSRESSTLSYLANYFGVLCEGLIEECVKQVGHSV